MVLAAAMTMAVVSPSPAAAQRNRDQIIAELRQMQSQMNELRNAQAMLAETLQELLTLTRSEQDTMRKSLADSTVTLQQLQNDLSVLSARVDETNGRIGNLTQEFVSIRQSQQPLIVPAPDAEGEEGEESQQNASAESSEDEEPAAVVTSGESLLDLYNQARNDFTQGRYKLAISGFQDVLDMDDNSDLADNAEYWIGECHLAQRSYDRAIASFDTVIRDYPNSNKRSDAYLKKGIALQNMDRRSEAMNIFELVIEQFPRTPHERIARSRLEDLLRSTPPRD